MHHSRSLSLLSNRIGSDYLSKENKYEDIDIVDIKDYEDVYDLVGNALFQLEKDTDYIAVYGKRDLISFLFTEMLKDDYVFGYADFDALDEGIADRVYLMIIRQNCTISVEPAISSNNVVIGHDAKVAFIDMDECKQNIVDYCVNSDKDVILFGYDDEEDCDIDCCDCCGNGVCEKTKDNATYKVNGKEVDKNEYEKAIEDIEEKYLDGIRDMLLRYCEIQDEMNEWRKLFR